MGLRGSCGSIKTAVSTGIIVLAVFIEIIAVASAAPAVSTGISNDAGSEQTLAQVGSETLILTQIMFRHGNRTPDTHTFPKDRYQNFQYPPFGRGHLTLAGKKMVYENGEYLRKRFGRFLGDTLTPEVMSVRSTNYPRTQITATLVSAGLWPPTKQQQWGPGLGSLYQPTYIENVDDLRFWGSVWYNNCPAFDREYQSFLKTQLAKSILGPFEDFRAQLSKLTGLDIKVPGDGYNVYQALIGQREYGLELPTWFNKTIEDKLYDYAAMSCSIFGHTDKLKRFRAGLLLKEMVGNFVAAATNALKPAGRKIFLFSAHDITLAGLLQALEVLDEAVPPYGSMIIMELHSIHASNNTKSKPTFSNGLEPNLDAGNKFNPEVLDELSMLLFLRNTTFHEPYPLTMPKCAHLCPLDQFSSLLSHLIPQNFTAECYS